MGLVPPTTQIKNTQQNHAPTTKIFTNPSKHPPRKSRTNNPQINFANNERCIGTPTKT
jgi:hypothetical protein